MLMARIFHPHTFQVHMMRMRMLAVETRANRSWIQVYFCDFVFGRYKIMVYNIGFDKQAKTNAFWMNVYIVFI